MRDLQVSLGLFGLVAALLASYGVRTLFHGRARNARTDADGGSVFLNKATMEMFYWLLNPVVGVLAALRVTPNMVTLLSLVPALGAGVALASGWFGLAAALATLSTFGDILDGLLARRLGVGRARARPQPVAPRPRREEQRNRHDSKKIHQTEKGLGGQCRRLTHDLGIAAAAGLLDRPRPGRHRTTIGSAQRVDGRIQSAHPSPGPSSFLPARSPASAGAAAASPSAIRSA